MTRFKCVENIFSYFSPFFQAEERKLAKLKKVLKPEEFEAATAGNITDRSQKLDSLQSQYKELEEHYLHVLERIDCY